MPTSDHLAEACALQERGSELFEAGQEKDAVRCYRQACALFRVDMEVTVKPETVRRYLLALQALTVSAAVTGRIEEARMAAGTGCVQAEVAEQTWQGDVFAKIAHDLDSLAAKLGGNCPVFLSDDPTSWPFED